MQDDGIRARRMPPWAWGALVVMLCLIVFLPAVRFPFMPFWDDDIHVHANPHLADLSWKSLGAMWSGPWQQLYIPLTYTVWAGLALLSRAASGEPPAGGALDPAWFHGANILLHAASAALAFVLLRRVLRAFHPAAEDVRTGLAAALGAGFFVFHPLQVEPVAWVSGLRDVLGGCLGLAALAVLFGSAAPPRAGRWTAASLLFLASLAAKPAGVALPLVAAVLAWMPFRWTLREAALRLVPWMALGAVWVQVTSGAQWAAELAANLVPVWMRPLVAADALGFYMLKVIWPSGLAADYGRSPDAVLSQGWLWWMWLVPAGLAAVLAWRAPARRYLVPLGVFTAALLPTLGLVPFNFQITSTVADRYAYSALLGPALALGMTVAGAKSWRPAVAAAIAVAMLALLTARRLPLWSEDLRLFAATLEVNPQSWKAMHNYASALDDRGRTPEAEKLMREVIMMRPESAEAFNDLAVMVWNSGRHGEALLLMRHSVGIRPAPSSAHNLAVMEEASGNADEAAAARRLRENLSSAQAP